MNLVTLTYLTYHIDLEKLNQWDIILASFASLSKKKCRYLIQRSGVLGVPLDDAGVTDLG